MPNAVGGTSGGNLQREIGAEADEIEAVEGRPRPVSVHKGHKPDDGDAPNLPNRQGDGQSKTSSQATSRRAAPEPMGVQA